MTYLIDTDWVIEYLKGRRATVETITHLASDGIGMSLITYGEVYEGIQLGRDPKRHEQGFLAFLRTPIIVLPPNKPIMKHFGQIRGHLRRSGQLIGDFDILIATTALHYDLTLLTSNVRHFSRIPALKLYTSS